MSNLGVTVAAINDGKILMIQREDFPVWALPGEAIDAGESLAEAAVREVFEETGITVTLTQLVGVYSRPTGPLGGSHAVVFRADVIRGSLEAQSGEVVDLGFFDPQNLPTPMFWWHDQPIKDAIAGVGGSVAYNQHISVASVPDIMTLDRQELYARRDRGELPVKELLAELCRPANPDDQTREVG